VPLDSLRQVVTTSGTSGAGEEAYPLDADDEQLVHRMAARGFAWAGVGPGCVVLNTLPLTTTAAGQWYYHGLRLLGANVLEAGTFPTERKLEYLVRFGADTLVGTPSYMLRLALDARRSGIDPAGSLVRRLVVAGESWSEDWMARLEREWGAKVFEQYGSTQRAMAWSCEAGALTEAGRGVLHALSDHGVYEVIDPATGTAVSEGPGELVVTPFASSASPLVRFATGDRVTVVGSCLCGRPGPLLAAGSVDRYDFMVKVRGVNLWPEALDSAVFGVGSVRDYEARVETDETGRELLRLDIELERDDGAATEAVAAAVKRVTGLAASVRAVPGDALTGGIEDRFRKRRRLHDRRRSGQTCA
jgi:phenylacetate-CoA ligase